MVEPREEYTRDTWFDIASAPWYTSGLWLWRLRPDASSAMQGRVRQGAPPFTPSAYDEWWTNASQTLPRHTSMPAARAAAVAASAAAGIPGLPQVLSLPPSVAAAEATEHFTVQCRAVETWLAALLATISTPRSITRASSTHASLPAVRRWFGWRFLFACTGGGASGGGTPPQAILVDNSALKQLLPSSVHRKARAGELVAACGGKGGEGGLSICKRLCQAPNDHAAASALKVWLRGGASSIHDVGVLSGAWLHRVPVSGLMVADGAKSRAAEALGIARTPVSVGEAAAAFKPAPNTLATDTLQEVSLVIALRAHVRPLSLGQLLPGSSHGDSGAAHKHHHILSKEEADRLGLGAVGADAVWGVQCPQLAPDPAAPLSTPPLSLDPWAGSFQRPLAGQVTTVFKRWYRGACHMQVLTTRATGQQLLAERAAAKGVKGGPSAEAPPPHSPNTQLHTADWRSANRYSSEYACSPIVGGRPKKGGVPQLEGGLAAGLALSVLRLYLAEPPQNATGLAEMLCGSPAIVPVPVVTASQAAALWPAVGVTPPSGPKLTPPAVPVLMLGDAAATAHYRLGIGINSALSALPWLHSSLLSLLGAPFYRPLDLSSLEQLATVLNTIVSAPLKCPYAAFLFRTTPCLRRTQLGSSACCECACCSRQSCCSSRSATW